MNRDFKYLCNELSLRVGWYVGVQPSPRLVNLTLLVLNDLLELFKVDSAGAQIGLFKISRVIIALSDARRTDLSAQPYEIILETIWVHGDNFKALNCDVLDVSSSPTTHASADPNFDCFHPGHWLKFNFKSASTSFTLVQDTETTLPSVDGGHARLNSGIQLQVWPRRRSRSSKILKRPSFDASASLAPTLLFSPAGPMVERLAAWVWNRFEALQTSIAYFTSHLGCGHTHHGLGLEGPKQWTFDLRYPYNFIQLQLVGLDSDFCGALTGRISALVLAGSRSSKFKFNTTSDSTSVFSFIRIVSPTKLNFHSDSFDVVLRRMIPCAVPLTVTVYSFNCVSELSSRYGRVWDRSAAFRPPYDT
ncbi:hypothetical protein C8R46DRAFT_1229837 [Mycena filopes]|nr:hypothetical protein C8R46DRAFT_1229837 [Mycena filopes]